MYDNIMDEQQLKTLFGNRVRELRKVQNLTQEELAERIWMDPQHLCKMENGSHFPTLKNIIKLADVFNVEVKDLFSYDNSEENQLVDKIKIEMKKLNKKELKFLLKTITSIKELR